MRARGRVSPAAGVVMAVTLTACASGAGSPASAPQAAATQKRVPNPAADDFKSVLTYAMVAAPTIPTAAQAALTGASPQDMPRRQRSAGCPAWQTTA